jgi:hypothetical protein
MKDAEELLNMEEVRPYNMDNDMMRFLTARPQTGKGKAGEYRCHQCDRPLLHEAYSEDVKENQKTMLLPVPCTKRLWNTQARAATGNDHAGERRRRGVTCQFGKKRSVILEETAEEGGMCPCTF